MKLPRPLRLLYDAGLEWMDDGAARLGAALAYYTVFSMAPLLIVLIAVAGLFVGRAAVEGELMLELNNVFGAESAKFIQDVLAATQKERSGVFATVVGLVILLLGATGLFAQLQDALNIIWDVKSDGKGSFLTSLRRYWLSMTMILGVGFLLLVSLLLSAILSAVTVFARPYLADYGFIFEGANLIVSLIMITLLFAMMFKYLPNVRIEWRDVWVGAAITALLFTIGKTLLGLYLGRSATTSTYGAAGGLVVIMLWSYYSSQIFLYGAEFTQVYARSRKATVSPAPGYVSTRLDCETEQKK